MKTVFLTFIAYIFTALSVGQTSRLEISQLGVFSSEDNGQAKIYLNQDSHLNEITIGKALAKKEFDVWRVQIYLGSGKNSRAEGTSVRNTFKTRYPDVDAELLYHSPFFKVQVGNFKTRIEAESFKKKIQGDYKSLWVINEVYDQN